MYSKLREVMRFLLTLIHQERSPRSGGGLTVVMTALSELPVTLTVSAAGPWCKKVSKSALQEVMEKLSLRVPPCDCIHEEELIRFTEDFGCLFFTYSFHVGNASSQSVETGQAKIKMFLHRLSVVYAQVKIFFEIRTDTNIQQEIFSGETGSKVLVMDHSITLDIAAYGQSPFSVHFLPSCPKMHQVLGDTFGCVFPNDVIEEGLCGELRVATMATLSPCMAQYPNWPTRLSCIRIIVYSPCGMPLMHQTQHGFLHSLATSLCWTHLGLSKVSCVESRTIQGSLCCEVELSVDICNHTQEMESGCSNGIQQNLQQWSHSAEQILTLFILTQYTDPFHSQLSDFISSEEALERHLDTVFWYNEDKLRAALLTTLKKALKGFQKRLNARQRLQSALSTVLSSVNSIVTNSCSAAFRNACYDSMKVKSTYELHRCLQQSLQSVVDGRFAPRRMCDNEKVADAVNFEQSSIESWEEAFEDQPEVSPKRTDSELESSCVIPKKRLCSQFSENIDAFTAIINSDILEGSSVHRSPLSPIQLPQSQEANITPEEPSVHYLTLTKLTNEQVEKQWLLELENLSEWD